MSKREALIKNIEQTMVFLWPIFDEMSPEPRRETKYPQLIIRKMVPALLCDNARLFSIVGRRGEKITRAKKLRKKIDVRSSREGKTGFLFSFMMFLEAFDYHLFGGY